MRSPTPAFHALDGADLAALVRATTAGEPRATVVSPGADARPPLRAEGGWSPWPFLMAPRGRSTLRVRTAAGVTTLRPGALLWQAAGTFVEVDFGARPDFWRCTIDPERGFVAHRHGRRLVGCLVAWREPQALAGLARLVASASDAEARHAWVAAALHLIATSLAETARPGPDRGPLIARYLDEHCHLPCEREHVARLFGVHPNHLARWFRRHHDCDFRTYLRRARCRRAAGLLVASDLAIGAIAEACGFGSHQVLDRAFRREYGCTPGGWRQGRGVTGRGSAR